MNFRVQAIIALDTLKKLGWGATCLTEDMEFTMKLSLNDTRVAFAYDAVVYDEKPLTLKQSYGQEFVGCKDIVTLHQDISLNLSKGIKERNFRVLTVLYILFSR